MMKSPTTKATAVSARGRPSVLVCSTAAPSKKFTPAPTNRPNDVQKANAVARTRVSNCSGNQRLKSAKLPPKETQHEQPRDERRQAVRKVERPAEAADNRNRHSGKVNRQGFSAADAFGDRRQSQATQYGADRQQAGGEGRRSRHAVLIEPSLLRQLDDRRRFVYRRPPINRRSRSSPVRPPPGCDAGSAVRGFRATDFGARSQRPPRPPETFQSRARASRSGSRRRLGPRPSKTLRASQNASALAPSGVSIVKATSGRAESAATFGAVGAVQTTMLSPVQ